MGPCVVSSDAARAPHRRDARRHAAALAPAQCRHGDARGLEVSPGGLLQNKLVPASNQTLPCAAGCFRVQGPPGASPARSSARQTPGATDNTSRRSPRSGGLCPPCSGPARPEHRPAAASRRSLQACIASLPLQSSWMSKTYLKSDHFNGDGSLQPTNSALHWSWYRCWECVRGRPVEKARHHCLSALRGPDGRGGQDCPCPKRAWAYRVRMPVLQLRHKCTYAVQITSTTTRTTEAIPF